MSRRYTEEEKAFLDSFIPGHGTKEVAKELARRFGRIVTPLAVESYKKYHGIHSGRTMESTGRFPVKVREWLTENIRGKSSFELASMINEAFGTSYTVQQIQGLCKRMKLRSGYSACFKPGHHPTHGFTPGHIPEGSKRYWFRKGIRPHNTLPVNTTVVDSDGCLKIKVAEPNVWKRIHVMVWEEHNGPVPKGCAVMFRDGNRLNCDIGNLILVTRQELMEMCRISGKFQYVDGWVDTLLTLARLRIKCREARRKGGGQ